MDCRWDKLEGERYGGFCEVAFTKGDATGFRAVAVARPVTPNRTVQSRSPFRYSRRGITCQIGVSDGITYECANHGSEVSCTLCIKIFGEKCFSGQMSVDAAGALPTEASAR